jgi:hypothetical protein
MVAATRLLPPPVAAAASALSGAKLPGRINAGTNAVRIAEAVRWSVTVWAGADPADERGAERGTAAAMLAATSPAETAVRAMAPFTGRGTRTREKTSSLRSIAEMRFTPTPTAGFARELSEAERALST